MTEATKNYVVLSWKPPAGKGLEGVMYYVEKVNSTYFTIYFSMLPVKRKTRSTTFSFKQLHASISLTDESFVCQCVSGTDSWQRVNTEIPVKSPRFALFDLAEGKSYSFRVRCCNSAGVGEPSDPTEATTVGDKLG